MVPELEKPRITEIHVRMDCNGCVQKIKKALHGITGIYDLYIDFPQQKLTIVGWADPEKIVKAIKKTRKTAVICSHTEPPDPAAQQPEQPPDGGAQPPNDAANPPPQEAPPADPPKEGPPPENPAPPPENPNPPPDGGDNKDDQLPQDGHPPQPLNQPVRPKDVGEVHMVYHHTPPPDYGYRYGSGRSYYNNAQWYNYPRGQGYMHELPPSLPPQPQPQPQPQLQPQQQPQPQPQPHPQLQPQLHQQPQPIYVTHSYSTYKPSSYVTEYEYVHTQPQPRPQPQPQPQLQPQTQPQPLPQPQPQPQPHQQPVYATQSYSTYKPSSYVTEYEYVRSPPQYRYYGTSRADHYSEDYSYHHNSGSNSNISSFFSDENPNACRIM